LSWNNTVTCSWCYKTGHNKNGCPDRKEYIQRNPDSYEARRDQQRKSRGRKCGYCEETGHTRRTCPALKQDREGLMIKNIRMRAQVYNYLQEQGLAPGALFTVTHWNHGDSTAMVERIQWQKIRVDNGFLLEQFPNRGHRDFILYRMMKTGDGGYCTSANDILSVVGPVSSSAVDFGIPEGWFDSSDKGTLSEIDDLQRANGHWYVSRYYLD